MRTYFIFLSLALAGVITAGAYAQTGVEEAGRTLSQGADDLTGKAQVTGDEAIDRSRDAVRGADQRTRDAVDRARTDVRDTTRSAQDNARDYRRGDLNARGDVNARGGFDNQRAGVGADARFNASRNFNDADRNADWRFVQRNGVWWYRTPMNTWMVQRDGRWVNYRGDRQPQYSQQRYYDDRVAGGQYMDSNRDYNQQADYQGSTQQQQYADSQTSYAPERHPQVGQQEWMCIDGRRRLVTVVSVRPVDDGRRQPTAAQRPDEQSYRSNRSAEYGDSSQGQRHTAARQMTPPPAPSPENAANSNREANLPEAPSRDQILDTAPDGAADVDAQNTYEGNRDRDADRSANADASGESDSPARASEGTASNTQTDAPAEMESSSDPEQ